MSVRNRISVTLSDKELSALDGLAAERGESVAGVAGQLIGLALLRERAHGQLMSRIVSDGGVYLEAAHLVSDIHLALRTPGVVYALTANFDGSSVEARQAVNFLAEASAWLDDERPIAARVMPPRLASTPFAQRRGYGIATTLQRFGGGDERDRTSLVNVGSQLASDKHQLSDLELKRDGDEADDQSGY